MHEFSILFEALFPLLGVLKWILFYFNTVNASKATMCLDFGVSRGPKSNSYRIKREI